MDGITSAAGASGSTGNVDVDTTMLKKSHDLMKQQSAELLAALPKPPPPPSPAGVGGRIDIQA